MKISCQEPAAELNKIRKIIIEEAAKRGSRTDSLDDGWVTIDETENSMKFVETTYGHQAALEESLWENSEILRNHPPGRSKPFAIKCSKTTLDSLQQLHRERIFPEDLNAQYRLLTVTTELRLKKLSALTLKHLFRDPQYWEINYPENIPDEVVLTCFEASLNRLFRTSEVYEHEVWEISKLSRGANMDESVSRALRSKVAEFEELGLERVPVYFRQRSLPIVIMKRGGKPETAICWGSYCQPLNVFGKNFDLSELQIDAFYLKYASYVLYKSHTCVHLKNLRNGEESCLVLENCTYFTSREDHVFAVTQEESGNAIWKWIEDDEEGGAFAKIDGSVDEIARVDFEPDAEYFLILKKSGSLSISHLSDNKLDVIGSLRGCFLSAWFHDGLIFTLSLVEGTTDELRVHRLLCDEMSDYEASDAGEWQRDDGGLDDRLDEVTEYEFTGFVKGGQLASLGGQILQVSQRGLELLDGDGAHVIVEPEDYVASSELCLFP